MCEHALLMLWGFKSLHSHMGIFLPFGDVKAQIITFLGRLWLDLAITSVWKVVVRNLKGV